MDRRKFISNAFSGIVVGSTLPKFANLPGRDLLDKVYEPNFLDNYVYKDKIKYPPLLKRNSKVAITAPASPTNQYETRHGVRFYQSLGCKVILGDTVKYQNNRFRYLSAPDKVRAKELMELFENPEIDAIHSGRGGYGVMRILEYLDFDVIRKNPKILVGYSDITALLNAIYNQSKVVSFHGPVASSTFDTFSKNNLLPLIFTSYYKDDLTHKLTNSIVINEGEASGKLVGGNLTIVSSTIGTEAEIDTDGSILFIEDVAENAYEIDRLLSHLILAGKFDNVNGILIGYFKNLYARKPFYPNKGFNIYEVIEQLIKPLGKPTLIQMPFGHIDQQITLPIGAMAKFSTNDKKLSINVSTNERSYLTAF